MKLILFLSMLLLEMAGAQQANTPQSEVKLTLEEFEEIFSAVTLKDAERRAQDQQNIQKKEYDMKLAKLEQELSRYRDARLNEQQTLKMFPDNFQVLQHKASGIFNKSSVNSGVEDDVASFDLELTFRVILASERPETLTLWV